MKVLLLGGTSEAMQLAKQLIAHKIEVIYSIAGLVRQPKLDCQIHNGGFQGKMATFLHEHHIKLLLDATHPYANTISQQAKQAAKDVNIDYWVYHRKAWQPTENDVWIEFTHWDDLLPQLQCHNTPFFAFGQTPLKHLTDIAPQQHWIVRTAIKHKIHHPQLHLITAIGGFTYEEEEALFKQYQFDVVICKNSGGTAVANKIKLARQSAIPVLMQARPVIVKADRKFTVLADVIDEVISICI